MGVSSSWKTLQQRQCHSSSPLPVAPLPHPIAPAPTLKFLATSPCGSAQRCSAPYRSCTAASMSLRQGHAQHRGSRAT